MLTEGAKKISKYIAIIFLLFIIIINARETYWYYTLPTNCYHEAIERRIEFHGLVTKKFIDSDDHNFQAIVLGHSFFENKIYITEHEDSVVWKEIRVNDTIIKQKGSLTYYLIRGKQKIAIPVKFYCKN
ncbi:hypothetical protein [Mucilaginibacter sp. L3T2-6]|uniref:hypothetical protein n=1 Tax=Mucilaginibacter sp. L3T2-6 TaxID=3062491 RepID=UPI002675D848|nr:hypothetical protein [Mucilaginibacter sp. L3T2-6]MDO3641587.1 hypothetical protein [Mucilaginibacter sp. L3T2-6]MDV6214081.1 hypothetical protein [Mucilaginibacter sp. L3T2-6]